MKKLTAILAVLLMVVSLSVSALAVDSNFVSSPENLDNPTSTNNDYVITSYSERSSLDDQGAEMEEGYSELQAEELGEEELVTSYFDISPKDENSVGPYNISLTISNPENFVALLHYVDGSWVTVNATLSGSTLSFTVDSLSPFAIVSKSSKGNTPTSPATGDSNQYVFIAGAVILAAGAAWFFAQSKKVKAN